MFGWWRGGGVLLAGGGREGVSSLLRGGFYPGEGIGPCKEGAFLIMSQEGHCDGEKGKNV